MSGWEWIIILGGILYLETEELDKNVIMKNTIRIYIGKLILQLKCVPQWQHMCFALQINFNIILINELDVRTKKLLYEHKNIKTNVWKEYVDKRRRRNNCNDTKRDSQEK